MAVNPEDFGAVVAPTVKIDPAQFGAIANVDEERGAPPGVRESVGASKKPEDKLTTLQSYYPDATPWGEDNFVYTDHETGNRTLYNPKGLDAGDVRENARILFEFLGGSVGATAAVVAGQMGPQVATPEEIITVPLATGAGAAVGGQVYDILSSVFAPHADTQTFLERTAGMGTDVLANAVGTRAGELLEGAVKKAASKGAALARSSGDEIYKAFNRMGIQPTAGAVSGSPTIQGMEQALSKLPASSDVIAGEYGKLIDDMGKYATNLASDVSPIEGRELVGAQIRKGADTFVKQFQAKAKTLYDVVDEYMPKTTKVQLTNLGGLLDNFIGKDLTPEVKKVLGTGLINQMKSINAASKEMVMDNLTMTNVPKGINYASLKALRTKVGGMLDDRQLMGDTAQADLKNLYGALSQDMELAAKAVGGKAEEAASRASMFWKAGRSRIDDVLQPIVNKKLNQDIYNAALSGAKNGTQKLRALKQSIPKDEWDSVVAQQIREMGLANPGAQEVGGQLFSPQTFFTNFTKLKKPAQDMLFDGPQYKGLSAAVDDLVKVSAALKDSAKMANNSGTAQQMIYMNMLTGGMGGLYGSEEGDVTGGAIKGMAIGAALPWVTAKLITSPKFVKWLADAGKIAVTQNGIGAHLGRLATMAVKDKELQPAINEYMRTISIKKEGVENVE